MATQSPIQHAPSRQRIDGWKAIGRFLGRDARTAQRWEHTHRLPVRRVADAVHSVYAWAHELRAWLDGNAEVASGSPAIPAASRAPGLLVLPFEFRSPGGSDRAFIGDAIGAEILNRLSAVPLANLRILSWATARAFRRSPQRADELAADLGIRYLVEGSVNDAGSRWTVDVRLVDAQEDRVVLTDRFGSAGSDVLKLQATIAEAVSGQFSLHLSGQMLEPFWNDEVDPAAFLAYIRASQAEGEGWTQASLQRAIDLSAEAIAIDPRFTPAYGLKGFCHAGLASYYDPSQYAQAQAMGSHAMRAGPLLATSNILDAYLATYYDYDWVRAGQRYAYLLDRLPADTYSRRRLALNLGLRCHAGEAQRELDAAKALDRSPRLCVYQAMLSTWRRDFEAAVSDYQVALESMPNDAVATTFLISALGLDLRDEARVRACVDALDPTMTRTWGPFYDSCVAVAANDEAGLAQARRELRQRALDGTGSWYADAVIAGAAGDVDGVVDSLTHAIDARRSESVGHSLVESSFDCARNDPRFVALLGRINLQP